MIRTQWRPILCTLLAFVAPLYSAVPSVHIAEIGLHGYFSTSEPTDIKLRIDPGEAAGRALKVRIEVGQRKKYPTRIDVFTTELDAKGSQDLDLPLFVYTVNQPVAYTLETNAGERRTLRAGPEGSYIRADLVDETGKTIASDTADPVMNGAEQLFVILCNEKAVCNTVQSQVLFSGSEEERDKKNRSFRFAVVSGAEAPSSWWSYLRASQVVLAAPVAPFTEQQRRALEQYVRQGGTLVMLERETGAADFLPAYRKAAITETAVPVGRGDLVRVEGLESKKLQELFSGKNLTKGGGDEVYWQVPRAAKDFASGVRSRSSFLFNTHFIFPRLLWIVIWLLSYIIIVGFVNFTVLRAMRHREWAWFTTPALALVYALVIYMVGNFHRPSNFAVDQVTLESLDERNPTAAVATELRVSSPRVQDTTLLTPTEAILMPPSGSQRPQAMINIEDHEDWEPGWEISYGKQRAVALPLLRWDFRDFEFRDFVQLPGTLHWNAAKRLRNDTGRSFEDALYIDHKSTVFLLGAVPAGAEIDLASVRWQLTADFSIAWRRDPEELKGGKVRKPVGLKEVVAEAICDCFHDREYFVGLSRVKPAWEPELAGLTPDRNRAVVTLVTLDAPHD